MNFSEFKMQAMKIAPEAAEESFSLIEAASKRGPMTIRGVVDLQENLISVEPIDINLDELGEISVDVFINEDSYDDSASGYISFSFPNSFIPNVTFKCSTMFKDNGEWDCADAQELFDFIER